MVNKNHFSWVYYIRRYQIVGISSERYRTSIVLNTLMCIFTYSGHKNKPRVSEQVLVDQDSSLLSMSTPTADGSNIILSYSSFTVVLAKTHISWSHGFHAHKHYLAVCSLLQKHTRYFHYERESWTTNTLFNSTRLIDCARKYLNVWKGSKTPIQTRQKSL